MILRPRQSQFVERSLSALDIHGNTLGVAPTGCGKSVMLSAVTGQTIRDSRANPFQPSHMTTEARLAELGRIIAAGILRQREQSSSISAANGDSSLAISATKSVSRPGHRARKGGR